MIIITRINVCPQRRGYLVFEIFLGLAAVSTRKAKWWMHALHGESSMGRQIS